MKTLYATLCLTMVLSVGCGKPAPQLEAPLEILKTSSVNGGEAKFDVQAKVDILIVVDNSLSMDPHQQNLANNIDKFVNAFAKNNLIDFHIGVAPVYDSVKAKKVTIHPAGQLLPLKGQTSDVRFATRETPNMIESLKQTIFMGTMKGPEFEESFSPVIAMLSPEMNKTNQNFYRADAHLAIIFITDADDFTPGLTPSDFSSQLIAAKRGDFSKIIASGALAIEDNCARDPGAKATGPKKILEFLNGGIVTGSFVSLCSSDFGKKIADFGHALADRVGRKVLDLPEFPDINSIEVSYGSQVIQKSYENGWAPVADDAHNQIVLSGKLKVKAEPGAQVTVKYTQINPQNVRNGRLKFIGSGSPR